MSKYLCVGIAKEVILEAKDENMAKIVGVKKEEYHKIKNIYERDNNTKELIEGKYTDEIFELSTDYVIIVENKH